MWDKTLPPKKPTACVRAEDSSTPHEQIDSLHMSGWCQQFLKHSRGGALLGRTGGGMEPIKGKGWEVLDMGEERDGRSYEKRGRSTQSATPGVPLQHHLWARAVWLCGTSLVTPSCSSRCGSAGCLLLLSRAPLRARGPPRAHLPYTSLDSAILTNPAICKGNGALLAASLAKPLPLSCVASLEISVENERPLQREGGGANTEGPFSVALLPASGHKTCCCLSLDECIQWCKTQWFEGENIPKSQRYSLPSGDNHSA